MNSLSDYIIGNANNIGVEVIPVFKVKKFIKNEEFLLMQVETGEITWKEFYEKRKKLAGEKLT